MLTPGVRFLVSSVPAIVGFVLLFFGAHRIAGLYGFQVPLCAILLGGVFSFPALITAREIQKNIRDRLAAKSLGARLVPVVRGRYPGNFDVLQSQLEAAKSGYPDDGLGTMMEECGPVFNPRMLWEDIYFTTCPEHIKLILATDFQNYVKGAQFNKAMQSVLGTGVFNSDGDMWKFHRNLTRPHFNREKITDFDLFDHHADAAIQLMKDRGREGYAVDIQDLLHRITLDTATEYLLGNCVHTLRSGLPYPYFVNDRPVQWGDPGSQIYSAVNPDEFAAAFQKVQYIIANRERIGWMWPLREIFEDATAKPMKVVNAFIDPLVQQAVERRQLSLTHGQGLKGEIDDGRSTLLDQLVKETTDPKVLKDETLNILVAGRDTTASTLTYVLHFLAKYPEVTTRLREEILGEVGPSRRPTFEDIKQMKYLRAVINETLRLFPVVPFNIRQNIKATTWPSPDPTQKPLYIPAGSRLPYSVFLMHRRKDLWGPDAEEFDPDRWLDDRLKKYLLKNQFIFLPFNAGPRICLGQQFAYNEMSYILVKLLQNFSGFVRDFDSTPPKGRVPASWSSLPGRKGKDKIRPVSHLTMSIEGGLWIRAQEAS